MAKRNIGGKARTRTLTLAEIERMQLHAFENGVQTTLEQVRKADRIAGGCGHHCLECENEELRARLALKSNPEQTGVRRAPG